jgi:HPt (histidine-containing phosphotransfer) domain-containing protein
MDQPETKAPVAPPAESALAAKEAAAAKLQVMLAQIWRTNEPALMERIGAIRAAEANLREGSLDETARAAARNAAHKLAGILGTFGLAQGTVLARQAEQLLDPPPGREQAPALAAILEELIALVEAKTAEVG